MTYSWYNIRSNYKNNTIKYTQDRGVNWNTITLKDGMYSYSDINDYIHQYMEQKNHHSTDSRGSKQFHINIGFILSTYGVLITLTDDKFQLNLRGTDFGEIIGFEKKLIKNTEYGTKLSNITNSIDVLNINTNAIKDSIVDGINTNAIAVINQLIISQGLTHLLLNLEDLYTVLFHLILYFCIYVTDSLGRPANFNGIDWFMTLILHSR